MINTSNLCMFEGRIARDPQYSTIQINNETVEKALFSIAVDRALTANQRQKAKNDPNIQTADFIPCSLLGGSVATLRNYFPQGKAIKVVGHYTTYSSTDQQTGQKKYGHIFEIDSIGFVTQDSKNVQQQQQNNQNNGGYQQAPQNNGYQQQPQQGGYQQAPQQNYQQPQQYQQPQPQNNFAMFDENESPF